MISRSLYKPANIDTDMVLRNSTTSKPFYLTQTTDAIKKHGSLSSISYFLLHSGVYTSGMRCMNNFWENKGDGGTD